MFSHQEGKDFWGQALWSPELAAWQAQLMASGENSTLTTISPSELQASLNWLKDDPASDEKSLYEPPLFRRNCLENVFLSV